jgi:hypothetical protein
MLSSCSAYYSTLMMEATFFTETSADIQWTTRDYILEARTLDSLLVYSLIISIACLTSRNSAFVLRGHEYRMSLKSEQ